MSVRKVVDLWALKCPMKTRFREDDAHWQVIKLWVKGLCLLQSWLQGIEVPAAISPHTLDWIVPVNKRILEISKNDCSANDLDWQATEMIGLATITLPPQLPTRTVCQCEWYELTFHYRSPFVVLISTGISGIELHSMYDMYGIMVVRYV